MPSPLPSIRVELTVEPHPAHVPPSEYSNDPAEQAFYAAQAPTALRFVATLIVNGKPVWEADVGDRATARSVIDRIISAEAAKRNVDFDGLAEALREELHCSDDTAFAIAMAFSFPPGLLAMEHVRFRWKAPQGRGHPIVADDLTRHLSNLVEGWWRATGSKPGTAERSYFARAVKAAQPFIPWLNRRGTDKTIVDIRKVLRSEMKKFDFEKVEWVRLGNAAGN
jgi:hypothetical protein